MAVEIERKFRVARMPDLSGARAVPIRQGYLTLPTDSVDLRLRAKGDKRLLTLKRGGAGLAREERETLIDAQAFDTLWPATEGRRIEKTRWTGTLPCGTTFELDVFEGRHAPLVLVEVEFDDLDAARAFIPPDWFGADVTEDAAYGNRVMALDGPPQG